jgi:hypothetical protein
MAITDVCKFEVKAHIDKYQKENKVSRLQAQKVTAIELGILTTTVRTMDHRAKKLIQNESTPKNNEGTVKRKRKIPQEKLWIAVENRLVETIKYIERNFEPPVKTSNGTKIEILGNLKLLKMYFE